MKRPLPALGRGVTRKKIKYNFSSPQVVPASRNVVFTEKITNQTGEKTTFRNPNMYWLTQKYCVGALSAMDSKFVMKYFEVRGSNLLLNTGTAKYINYISTYIKYVSTLSYISIYTGNK